MISKVDLFFRRH